VATLRQRLYSVGYPQAIRSLRTTTDGEETRAPSTVSLFPPCSRFRPGSQGGLIRFGVQLELAHRTEGGRRFYDTDVLDFERSYTDAEWAELRIWTREHLQLPHTASEKLVRAALQVYRPHRDEKPINHDGTYSEYPFVFGPVTCEPCCEEMDTSES